MSTVLNVRIPVNGYVFFCGFFASETITDVV